MRLLVRHLPTVAGVKLFEAAFNISIPPLAMKIPGQDAFWARGSAGGIRGERR